MGITALDRFGRVTDQIWNDYGATAVRDRYTYTYDRVGNRMSRDNELDSDFDEDYTYDSLNRLTDFDRGDGFDQSWNDLDALGNWSTFDDGTEQTREVNEANEIEKIDGSPNDVAYDAAGNMIEVPKLDGSGEHFCLKYDAWNRLAAVYDDNGTTLIAKYEYDAAGRRIEKETYSGGSLDEARHYYYGGTWQCVEERVEVSGVLPGDADVQYVWGAKYVDNLILRDRDTDADGTMDERLYALADANYNVTALFDEATGTVVERFVYDAYGNVTELDPDDFTAYTGTDYDWEYTYTTRRLDDETGLMYYRHRYYDADLGQFVSRDPSRYPGCDANLYRYTFNNPVLLVDPSGLQTPPLYTSPFGGSGTPLPSLPPLDIIFDDLEDYAQTLGEDMLNEIRFRVSEHCRMYGIDECKCKGIGLHFARGFKKQWGEDDELHITCNGTICAIGGVAAGGNIQVVPDPFKPVANGSLVAAACGQVDVTFGVTVEGPPMAVAPGVHVQVGAGVGVNAGAGGSGTVGGTVDLNGASGFGSGKFGSNYDITFSAGASLTFDGLPNCTISAGVEGNYGSNGSTIRTDTQLPEFELPSVYIGVTRRF